MQDFSTWFLSGATVNGAFIGAYGRHVSAEMRLLAILGCVGEVSRGKKS